MGMQINHNIAALNAWRNLGVSNSQLGKSLEKLSSGFRINRGADDPAGLLISEQLRAQIGGLDQAVRNASDAISMVQTAEGALTEMNNMLNSIRSLAVHAANTGANDTNAIGADQTAVDKAVESIQRIATTTKYAGKNLLDGSAGTAIDLKTAGLTTVSGVIVGQVGQSGDNITYCIETKATEATKILSMAGTATAFSVAGTLTVWTENCGTAATVGVYAIAAADTRAAVIAKINSDSASTGVFASAEVNSQIALYSCAYGDSVKIRTVIAAELAGGGVAVDASAEGVDIVLHLKGGSTVGDEATAVELTGSGLTVYGSSTSEWSGTQFAILSDANTTGEVAAALSIVTGNLQFSLTEDASSDNIISYSISDMRATKIGVVSTLSGSSIDAIKSSAAYALSTDAAGAVQIIDDAINDVSTQRANLGAFQKYTLETTINNLGVTKENLASSESRVRDVDMAAEMMDFTKNQILVQAGTAMLAQANQLPQSVMQLLGR